MRRIQRLIPHLVVAAWVLLLAPPLNAQSATTALVSGTISGPGGGAVPGSLITLTSLDRGSSQETTADGAGGFRFALVAPGAYELRAEALGYRPVIARTLTLTGGQRVTVALAMVQAPPPVLTVDTVSIGAVAASRLSRGGIRLGTLDLEDLPQRFEEPTTAAALAPSLDASLGSQGLPGSMTLTVVDGVPVYRAPHPVARAELVGGAAFPRTALAGVTVLPAAPNLEWGGSAAGHVGMNTLTSTPADGLVVEGGWSGGPLWSSGKLGSSTPTLLSFQGAGRTTIPVTPGASQIVVSGEAFRQDTPLTPRVSEGVATGLAGLDPDLIATLSEPSVEQYSRFSGLLRFDALSDVSYLFVRGAAGYAKREFDGPGPLTLARTAALPEESIEYSFASGYIREFRPALSFELRAGLAGSRRDFDPGAGSMRSAFLVGSGSSLGSLARGSGESSRTDFMMSPVVLLGAGGGTLRLGADLRLTKNSLLSSRPADYFFSDGAALVAGQGYVGATAAPRASFSTQELGGFVQFDTEPVPGLFTSIGTRFSYERIPGGDATLNTAWLQASGLRNDVYPSGFGQFGARASLTWEPTSGTRLFGAVAVNHGDLDSRVVGQLLGQDVGALQTAFAGSGLTWPGGTVPAALPTLTVVGPDTRAPRSMQATAGFVRQLVGGWSVHLGGAFRRTDFLMRRRNLNLPLSAQAADPEGREIYGTLQQDGSLITATGPDARRFTGFRSVWALDPDGWSEYAGATGGLEYASEAADLFVTYTRSETTDNWIGAAGGSAETELSPLVPEEGWSDATSDFDVPHRVTAALTARMSPATLTAVYRFRSGYPFTPRYRNGVDANGDGSLRNDVAYVDATTVTPLLSDWPCLDDQVGGFAVRNSCRGPSAHSVDVRLRVRVGRLAGREASLVIEGFNLIESSDGVVDEALLLVDPTGSITTSPDGSVVTIPFMVNPDFGSILYSASRGRMIRVGFRIG